MFKLLIINLWLNLHGIALPVNPSDRIQRVWDAPGIAKDKAEILAAATTDMDKARLLATSAPHSSDWLFALPVSSCGLRLDNEAVRVAVALRLGLEMCEPHQCPCGTMVDARGTHGLSCRKSAGRGARHQQLNDLAYRAIRRADINAVKEPVRLVGTDGKRPSYTHPLAGKVARCLPWDVTFVDMLAISYVTQCVSSSGASTVAAAARKRVKYACIANTHIFVPVARCGIVGSSGQRIFKLIWEGDCR